MVRINLATRPFYNERMVHLLLGTAGLLAAAMLGAGALLLAELSSERAALAAEAARDEAAAQAAAAEAQDLLRQVASGDPDATASAVADARALIDRRLFSWTALFNHIEQTLPDEVRLVSVQPEVNGAGARVALEVIGRSVAAIGAFMAALEATGAFSGVLPQDEEAAGEGIFRARLVADYSPLTPGGAPARDGVR